MIKLVTYIFYYVFIMIGGRFFFTLFFYKSYSPPAYGYSSSSKRQMAFQLDVGIVLIITVFLSLLVTLLVSAFSQQISFFGVIESAQLVLNSSLSSLFILLLIVFMYCVYSAVFELTVGATPGKRFMEIHSVTTKFKRLHSTQVILRNSMKFVSILFSPIFVFVAYIDKKRRWPHDKMALSVVIDTQKIEVS